MNNVKRNIILHMLTSTLRGIAMICVSGTLMQIFLSSIGFSGSQIYLYSTAGQAAQLIITLTCSRFGDRGNFFRRLGFVSAAEGVLLLFYLPLCIRAKAELSDYILLLSVCFLQSAFMGLFTVLNYKLPYFIFRVKDYGRIISVCGVISSGISIGIGALMTALTARFSYSVIMPWILPFSAGVLILSGILKMHFRSLIDPDTIQEHPGEKKKNQHTIKEMLRHPVFYQLVGPNLIRGFASGMTTVFAVIASVDLGYSEQTTTSLVSLCSGATLLACALFGVLSRRVCDRHIVFAGSLAFVCMPLLLIPDSPGLFLALVTVITFGKTLMEYAVPALLLRAVPGEIAGSYNAYRMILQYAGSLLATTLASMVSTTILLPVAMVFQIITGAAYCFLPVLRKAVPSAKI